MLYAIDFKAGTYLYDDIDCGDNDEVFIEYAHDSEGDGIDYQFVIDDRYAVTRPRYDKRYAVLLVENDGTQVATIGLYGQIKKYYDIMYIEKVFKLDDLLTKGVLL